MDNYHVLKVTNVGPTNKNPARVKIISERFKATLIIPYTNDPGSISPALPTAINYLTAMGFEFIGQGEGNGHYYLISTTFKNPKKS